ncbi:hypothetical protein ACQPZX_16570 [Actinoplanes sp. CA-142083]|uniref:hypothetical protein n=1 Tax=Actinoplanes sp. CA-142083 TaxID=3239903 RepID=UPI003D8B7034
MPFDVARRAAAAAAALLVLAVAACGGNSPATPQPTQAPPVSASAEPSSEAPPSASASAPVTLPTSESPPPTATATASVKGVKLVKQGGIAGIDQSIEVRSDGSWQRSSDGNVTSSGKLTGDQMAQLQKLLADPRLPAEGKQPTGLGRCSDAFVYVLTSGKTVIRYTACGQTDKPAVTMKIIELLQNAAK